jgi:hypothetical protein
MLPTGKTMSPIKTVSVRWLATAVAGLCVLGCRPAMPVALRDACGDELESSSGSQMPSGAEKAPIQLTETYGECEGYCSVAVTVTAENVTWRALDKRRPDSSLRRSCPATARFWAEMQGVLQLALDTRCAPVWEGKALCSELSDAPGCDPAPPRPDECQQESGGFVFGCPDCADQGAARLELAWQGRSLTLRYEPEHPPAAAGKLAARLHAMLGAFRD